MPTGERSKRRRRSASRGDLIRAIITGPTPRVRGLTPLAVFATRTPRCDLGADATTWDEDDDGAVARGLLGSEIMRQLRRRGRLVRAALALAALALAASSCVIRYAQVRRVTGTCE